jgi:hypothetical protein
VRNPPNSIFEFSSGLSILSKIVIGRQFRGPPNSGNGGYVCGVLAKGLDGPVTAMLRAPPPLDVDLDLEVQDGAAVLTGEAGLLIGQSGPATQALPEPPPAPSLEAARAAGARSIAFEREVHPPCFTCGVTREDGLRVLPGQLAGAAPGVVACVWTPDAAFADADGVVGSEIVWAALDCPGIFAWIETEGRPGGLLGTMTGEVTAPVRAGEDYVVLAWPIEASGRKKISGVALYDGQGRVMARGHQVWITLNRAPAPRATAETATA